MANTTIQQMIKYPKIGHAQGHNIMTVFLNFGIPSLTLEIEMRYPPYSPDLAKTL